MIIVIFQSVDKKYDAKAQLESLKLLFKALRRSTLNYGEFRTMNGLHMLTQIMNTATAYMNDEIIDELCNFLFSELEIDENNELQVGIYTVINEPEFLIILLSTTDLWRNDNFKYWIKLIELTSSSIDINKNKFFEFNGQLLHRVSFLKPLLNALLDMQQKPESFTISTKQNVEETRTVLVNGICSIINDLVSSPYRCHAVHNIWNFILLSHAAQDTYLDYVSKGHADWIHPDEIEIVEDDESTSQPSTGSMLSAFFEKVLMNFDKDKIAELWNNKNSVSLVRKTIFKSEQDYRIFTASTSRLDSICPNYDVRFNDDESVVRMKNIEKLDHWLIILRRNFLSIMCNIVLSSEDSLMAVIELDVLSWKTIVVQLTNQSHPEIRNLVFLLLQNFFLRCSEKYKEDFIKHRGFLLLANQLKKHPVGYEIADSLFSIFCGECVKIRDGLDEEHLESIETTSFRYASFHSLFALMEESVSDKFLFWTVCSTLKKIFEANNTFRRAMIDCGVVDTMINVLRLVCVQQPEYVIDILF